MVSNMYIITLWEITLVIGETLFYSLKSATLSDGSTMKKIISGYMFQAKKVFKSTKEHILKVWAIRIFDIAANPMKYYNKVFDVFLYQGVFILLFSFLLLLLDDRYAALSFKVSISSIIIAGVLWFAGRFFKLFAKEDQFEEMWLLDY